MLFGGLVALRGGILWNIGSWGCACNVSALLKLLLAIPCLMILASLDEIPLRDDGLEGGREFTCVFANNVSLLLKLPVPASRLMYTPLPLGNSSIAGPLGLM
jgi:hypothetical protein